MSDRYNQRTMDEGRVNELIALWLKKSAEMGLGSDLLSADRALKEIFEEELTEEEVAEIRAFEQRWAANRERLRKLREQS
jgi:hypothetical protein